MLTQTALLGVQALSSQTGASRRASANREAIAEPGWRVETASVQPEQDDTACNEVTRLLKQLVADNAREIKGAAIVSGDGLLLFGHLDAGVNMERLAATAASIIGVSTFATGDLRLGDAEEVILRGNDGAVLVLPIAYDLILVAPLTCQANLGIVRLEMRDTGAKAARILANQRRLH